VGPADLTLDTVIDGLTRALTLATREQEVDLPTASGRLDHLQVARLLDDPTRIRGFDRYSASRKAEALTQLAVWLDTLPVGALPARLRSRAARLRFLVWSLPFRVTVPGSSVLATDASVDNRSIALTEDAVLERARAAREDWLAYLRGWEDDPWLATQHATNAAEFEADLLWLTENWPTDPHLAHGRLALVPRHATSADRAEDHQRAAADIVETQWLPRSSLLGAARAFAPGARPARWLPWLLPLPPAVVAALFSVGVVLPALWLAVGVLAAVMVVAVLAARRSSLLLLRIPAAAGVGTVALLSFTTRWWLAADAWHVGAGLLGVSGLYLLLEARLHGATLGRAAGRAAVLLTIATLYAFVLNLTVLGMVAPSIADSGQCLAGWWHHPPWQPLPLSDDPLCVQAVTPRVAAPSGLVLVTMTGWSLAIGLAAQILWDDRPVTAPLGRLRRVRGGQP